MPHRHDRKTPSIAVLALVGTVFIGLTSCGSQESTTEVHPSDEIELVMGFRPDVQFAPMYMMVEKGYAADEQLDITFRHLPETEAVELVAVDELQFAIVSGEQVLLAREQELPVVYVMAWWQDYPVAIAAPESGGIQTVADLEGKRVGIPGLYGASYIGLRALLSVEGIDVNSLNLESIGYTQVEALYQGLEDAVVIYANNEPLQLAALGMPVNLINVADYVELASNGLITSEKTIAENPELVRRMVAAFTKGVEATLENPDEAFEVSKLYVEGLEETNSQVPREVLQSSIPFWVSEPIGHTDPVAWENMQRVLLEMGLLQTEIELTEAYTNEFIQ